MAFLNRIHSTTPPLKIKLKCHFAAFFYLQQTEINLAQVPFECSLPQREIIHPEDDNITLARRGKDMNF